MPTNDWNRILVDTKERGYIIQLEKEMACDWIHNPAGQKLDVVGTQHKCYCALRNANLLTLAEDFFHAVDADNVEMAFEAYHSIMDRRL